VEKDELILVSVDDHVIEPPTMFDNQLTAKQRETAPRFVRADGKEQWIYGDRKATNIGLNAVAGRPPEEYGFEPFALEGMRKGCWDIDARIDDMNANGILGSLCFPSFPGMDGVFFLRNPDKKEALLHVQAYNNWHIDEWCGKYPGRFIPLALVPFWDVDESVKEVERVLKKGCHAISFPDNPKVKNLPSLHSPHWNPLWEVCAANNVVINCHIGSGNQTVHPSMESPINVWTTTFPMAIAVSAADWLHMEALQRLPLKIALTEGGIGWIPYLIERADFTQYRQGAWTNMSFGGRKPSEVFREHFYACFVSDEFGVANLERIGEDIVCYECDYPHSDSLWPHSPEALFETIKGLTRTQVDKITHLNAMKAYGYDPFSVLKREECTVGALREKARKAGVDVSPKRLGSAHKPLEEGERRVVTSGDIMKIFA
jgi:predicted TIM-barrel fold metal-dependent hydrolase